MSKDCPDTLSTSWEIDYFITESKEIKKETPNTDINRIRNKRIIPRLHKIKETKFVFFDVEIVFNIKSVTLIRVLVGEDEI